MLSSLRRLSTHPIAPAGWDRLLWGSGAVALAGIVLSSFVPVAADLAVLFSVTLLLNGPYGLFIPAAQEPVIMVFARLHPPAVVAAVAAMSVTTVEYLNYRLFGAVLHSRALTGVRESRQMTRVTRWFHVQPFLTVAAVSITPIPFWLVRIVAATARYPIGPYLSANAIGRFCRFWVYGVVGLLIPVSSGVLLLGGTLITVVLGIGIWRRRASTAVADEGGASPLLRSGGRGER